MESEPIDFNDAQVYYFRATQTQNIKLLIRLFTDISEEVLFELMRWINIQNPKEIDLLIQIFNWIEHYEISAKILTAKTQLQIVNYTMGTNKIA